MADFDIERPTLEAKQASPTYSVNTSPFTIEISGSIQGQKGDKGDPGTDGKDGKDGKDGIDGVDGQDGVGVQSIIQTSTSHQSGGTNIITSTLTDGTITTFEIMNGEKGDDSKAFEYSEILSIRTTSDDLYLELSYYIENRLPFSVKDGYNTYQVVYTYKHDEDIKFYYMLTEDHVHSITMEQFPVVTITEDDFYIQEKITNSNKIDFSLIDNAPISSTDAEDMLWWSSYNTVNDANFSNGYYTVVKEPYRLGDLSTESFINTEAIMHNVSANNWNRLDDVIDGKQETLISGTNIKTINNNSILGSGDLTIETIFDATFVDEAEEQGINLTNEEYQSLIDAYIDGQIFKINGMTATVSVDGSGNVTLEQILDNIVCKYDISSTNNNHTITFDTTTLATSTDLASKQNTLVSGTNIKTINNESLLGSGNIDIQGSQTDVQINGSSIVSNDVADIQVEGTYNASTNKIATMSEIPTKVSDLSNDSGFITNTVNNLTNYYTKTNTYTKTEIDNLISAVSTLDIEVVQTLPTQDISTTTIYLVPKTPSANDAYDEYIYVNNSWEHIGSTEVDLSNYYTKTQTDGLLNNKANTTDVQNNKNLTRGIEYIVGTQAEATNLWTGVSTDTGCSSGTIYTGKTIIYHLPVAGTSTAATLNLTLPDASTTGAKNIYRQASSTVTTTFAADCDILMVYDGTQWKVNAYVDTTNSNSIGYQLRTDKSIYVNGASTSIYRYQLLVQTENGLEPFTSTNNKTGTTKTQLSPKYLPGGDIRYYASTTTIASDGDITSGSLWMQYNLDLRYSFNITTTTLTAKKPVYMKMSKNADGTLSPVYSANSGGHPLTQTLPTTADGYVYLHLGTAYSGYQLQLEIIHPMYEYKNGKLREYIDEQTGGGGSATDVQVNGTSITSGGVANLLTETAYNSSTNKIATISDLPTVPTNISSFTNDSGYITGLVMLTYGTSTWQDFLDACNSNKVVYCKVTSQYGDRMAFLAYKTATIAEFQYYRSLSTPSVSDQVDEVYVYTLKNNNTWTTTTRKASSTIAVGTGLSRSYTANTRTMSLSVDTSTMAQKSDLPTKVSDLTNDAGYITGYTETDPVFTASAAHGITSTDITNWNNKSTFSGSYNDLTDKPTIPTVNNATLTIQKNGTTVKTFTANASSNVTANITVPTKTSDLNNDSGFTTNTGTITSVKMNGSTISSSGEADLGTVLTSHQSIKTINSNSLVGSGNLTLPVITELTSPVILNDLTDGYYHLPAGCVLKIKESENDNNPSTYTTIGTSALMQFKIKTDSGYPLFSYWIIEDSNDATYDSGGGDFTPTGNGTKVKCGMVSPYTSSSWNEREFRLERTLTTSEIVDNLTTNDASKVLSAKQGKALKDAMDNLISLSTTTWIDSLF